MKAIQEHLGHTSIAMTERYSHLSQDFQKEQVNLLNGLCGEGNCQKISQNLSEVGVEGETTVNATS